MTLMDGLSGKAYTICKISGEDGEKRRLLDMGFTPHCKIKVLSLAPFGGTILVSLRNFTVALRDDAAKLIEIEV